MKGIEEIGKEGGDEKGRGEEEGIDNDEKLNKVIVRRVGSRLKKE